MSTRNIVEELREEGRTEGRDEGRKEGQLKGMRQMLLRLLEERFGSLPQKTRRRVGALASARELEGLLRRALTAGSLEELELG